MISIQEKDRSGKPYFETLDPPARQFYCALKMAAWMLRQRGTDPHLLRYIEGELADIQQHWRAAG